MFVLMRVYSNYKYTGIFTLWFLRDFVQIRIKAVKNGNYYIVGRSVDFPGCPPKPGLIRYMLPNIPSH